MVCEVRIPGAWLGACLLGMFVAPSADASRALSAGELAQIRGGDYDTCSPIDQPPELWLRDCCTDENCRPEGMMMCIQFECQPELYCYDGPNEICTLSSTGNVPCYKLRFGPKDGPDDDCDVCDYAPVDMYQAKDVCQSY